MNNKRSQYSVMNDLMTNIMNEQKVDNIVNDSFAHKPDGLVLMDTFHPVLVSYSFL